MSNSLSLLGGKKTIKSPFPPYVSVDNHSVENVLEVLKSGKLSGFYGSWGPEFYGGQYIRKFEEQWGDFFKVNQSITFNSATSALYAAMGAIDLQPGDEVIVPPLTMSATVMAPLVYGGIPVFVDIEPETFCLDVKKVESAVTDRTKAILTVNLFGHPANLFELKKIAQKHGLYLIEDNAQAPTATINDVFTGTVGDIGIFSLNYHKHIHTGEGGICVTDSDELGLRLKCIRNHGENIVEPLKIDNISGLVGFNYRMTELSAAIGLGQLRNIETHVSKRVDVAKKIIEGLSGLEGITLPIVKKDCTHVYYILAIKVKPELGLSRELYTKALQAEGVPLFNAYVKPLYHLPVFRKRKAFGDYPFNLTQYDYAKCFCENAEKMYNEELVCFEPCAYELTSKDISLIVDAFNKVHSNVECLKDLDKCHV